MESAKFCQDCGQPLPAINVPAKETMDFFSGKKSVCIEEIIHTDGSSWGKLKLVVRFRFDPAVRDVYEITFDDYILVNVIPEEVSTMFPDEVFEGNAFRVYSKSKFIDYANATVLWDAYDYKNYTHYCLIGDCQIIEVLSSEEPTIAC